MKIDNNLFVPKYSKRLMKLNMPISGDNTVLFTPTLFALVRTSLGMAHVEKECFRDSSFRKIIKRIWPNITTKTLDVMMPEQTGRTLLLRYNNHLGTQSLGKRVS